jgi:ribonuclease R
MKRHRSHRHHATETGLQHRQINGLLSVHRDGYGFVTPDDGSGDIFIPARYLRRTLHGDRVEVAVERAAASGKREGRVVRVIEPGVSRLVGRYRREARDGVVIPDEQRIGAVTIPATAAGGARTGQVVVVDITAYPTDKRGPVGRVVEVLGFPDDPYVEVASVIRRFDLPCEFPPDVIAEAERIPVTPGSSDEAGRIDLRDLVIVTIDGETARDFDDAVAIRRDGDTFRLWVSIADVAYYVRPGSALDREALLRGTSVYFPDRCIPMLPEALSNGICSLNPGLDRLAVTAELVFSASGELLTSSFYRSVIRSVARLTYTQVADVVEKGDRGAVGAPPGISDHLLLMNHLAKQLTARRSARGSIDFDLPETQLVLDLEGETTAVLRGERNQAHRIIEEFMLAANEAVASFLERMGAPSLHRIHEPPDQAKLAALAEFLRPLGLSLGEEGEGTVGSEDIRRLLVEIQGRPEERLVNRLLLRSMKQARYAAENLGHFGLASSCYTHFTSPIRRYPDLVVHRVLNWTLQRETERKRAKGQGAPFPGYPAALADLGEATSRSERNAMEAERDLLELKKVLYMVKRVGETFDGVVDGVTPFGLFVELTEVFVEGMVHISTLPADSYRFLETEHVLLGESSGRRFRIGDQIRVLVVAALPDQRRIDFVLAEAAGGLHSTFTSHTAGDRSNRTRKEVSPSRHGTSTSGAPSRAKRGRKSGPPRGRHR